MVPNTRFVDSSFPKTPAKISPLATSIAVSGAATASPRNAYPSPELGAAARLLRVDPAPDPSGKLGKRRRRDAVRLAAPEDRIGDRRELRVVAKADVALERARHRVR